MNALLKDSDSVQGHSNTVLSVDAMGGDKGPAAIVAGLDLFLKGHPAAQILLHGNEAVLAPLVEKLADKARIKIIHANGVVTMDDKPTQVMRTGKDTSMWSAIESVRSKEAQACISCGNTGALMALSTLRLRRLEGVKRPAIAVLWPSSSASGLNIMLDGGADYKAEAADLVTYGLMGAAYARNAFNLESPRVGLLNIGTEDHKGPPELHEASQRLATLQEAAGYTYVGFVEGNDLPGNTADVIVTDGFTGNVALKTGEGVAKLVSAALKASFKSSWLGLLGAMIASRALKRFKDQLDPRRSNGGVFLGLNGTVVKSHGSSDATSFQAALEMAFKLAEHELTAGIASSLATSNEVAQVGVETASAH